jgi:hypothetical protein
VQREGSSGPKATFHVPIRPPGESKIVPFPVAGIVSEPMGSSSAVSANTSLELLGAGVLRTLFL